MFGKLRVIANQKAKALALEVKGHIRVAGGVERLFVRAEQLDLAVARQKRSIVGDGMGRVEQPVFNVFRQTDGQAHFVASAEVGDVFLNLVPRLRGFTGDRSVPGQKGLGKDQHVGAVLRAGGQCDLDGGDPLLHAAWLRCLIETDDHGSDAFRSGQMHDKGATVAG